jgi:DNA replication protein DnaC
MSTKNLELNKEKLKQLKLYYTANTIDKIIEKAIEKSLTCEKFLELLLEEEIRERERKKLENRLKQACFPEIKTLDEFNLEEQKTLNKRNINQLKELSWLEKGFNLVFLGPPGVGKTHITLGIGIEAIYNGYKVKFQTMADLVHLLKTQEISSVARNKLKRIIGCDLLIIDDLMFMAMEKYEGNLFFQLINKLHGQTSIIITSNKSPEDWGDLLGDAAITTAILDRIVYKCEIINFYDDDSYRLKHRETIF